jgi:hypothetical protein
MSRIDGAPTIVRTDCIFQDCLTILNGAFADGNGLQFELGLNGLMDFCADSVEIGDCQQWWNPENRSTLWLNKMATGRIPGNANPEQRY